ncbi:division/outer membrane stress-associated lipid-binding lipoprotein [Idiomarina xiamenensis]|uniref:BON domain-containing protein n=1 Tax=Idiomarina xiamenensis 10-D-4 TaxID=740709 RepID=K2KBY0_9GAMM|nr:division/outer membrane stress-associated lipid-binding lipoprotein [Idiomarina xiamenensis]EKE85353.1 hypothetical protein A10D4_03375 [Idiomarina xiamenensis 10-D-4]
MKTLTKTLVKPVLLSLAVAGTILLQGCAVAVIGATAVGVSAASDPRSVGTQIDDQTIELRVSRALADEKQLVNTHINAISYNNSVLLVGQVPAEHLRGVAERTVSNVDGVQRVYNQLRVGQNSSLTTRSHDSWITSKVKVNLVAEKDFDGSKIKVVTENGEVFLLGLVTAAEAEKAIDIARNINGVSRVVNALEIKR